MNQQEKIFHFRSTGYFHSAIASSGMKHFPVSRTLECGGVDVMIHSLIVAKGSAVGEVLRIDDLETKGQTEGDGKGAQIARVAQMRITFVMADKVVVIQRVESDDGTASVFPCIKKSIA